MNILAVVAHPDDEVLGCGGTLAKHAEAGDEIQVLYACTTAADNGIKGACDALGARFYGNLGFPDQALDNIVGGFKCIVERILYRIVHKPDTHIVYTHNPDDLNLDHQIVARAVLTAFRPCHSQAAILAFETLSSTEWGVEPFAPNHWEVLTWGHVDKKIAALNCYRSEIRELPHPRNEEGINAQARWRGAQCGNMAAEAFRVLRSMG